MEVCVLARTAFAENETHAYSLLRDDESVPHARQNVTLAVAGVRGGALDAPTLASHAFFVLDERMFHKRHIIREIPSARYCP